MKDIPLHDIKPLVEVPDNSFIYLVSIGVLLAIALVFLLVVMYKMYKKSKIVSLRKINLKKIHAVDMSNAKEAAYQISAYGKLLAQSEKQMQILENLDKRLDQYKYRKEVSSIDEETLKEYKDFLEALDAT